MSLSLIPAVELNLYGAIFCCVPPDTLVAQTGFTGSPGTLASEAPEQKCATGFASICHQSQIHADGVMDLCEGTACQDTKAGWRATSRHSSAQRIETDYSQSSSRRRVGRMVTTGAPGVRQDMRADGERLPGCLVVLLLLFCLLVLGLYGAFR